VWAVDGVDNTGGVAAILGAVSGVDLGVDAGIGFLHEGHVLLDAACPDPTFMAHQGATVPGGRWTVHGSNVEVVAVADYPDRQRVAQRAVASERRDLQFFGCSNLFDLFARPDGHWYSSLVISSEFHCSMMGKPG
jgi:hypothetical protein